MRRRTQWLIALGAFVVLPVGLLAIALSIIDPNDYKPQIVAAVQEATGRALNLNGPLRVSVSLWPTIEASDVRLANLPGGSRSDMAWAERIEAQLSLPALLRRRIEVIRLLLIGPNILFEEVAHKPNWEFNSGRQEAPDPRVKTSLRFRNVHVENGMVTFRFPARTKVVGIRALAFEHLTDGGALEVSSTLVYSDYQPFSLRATAQPTGGITDPWNTQLAFAAYDATASGKGTMNLAGDYDLLVDGQAPALERLNALLPEMQLPALHGVQFSTHLTNGPVRGDLPIVGKTELHIGSADLNDRVPGLKLSGIAVSLPTAGGAATIAGAGNYVGQPFALRGNFGVPEHPDGPVSVPIDLTANAQGASAKGSLAVKGKLLLITGRFNGLDATMALRTPALADARPMTSPLLPALTDVSFNGRVVIPGDSGSISFRSAKLSSEQGDLNGDTTIGLGSALALDTTLHSTRMDLDRLLTAFGVRSTDLSMGGSGPLFSNTPLNWATLKGPTIAVAADADSVTFQQQAWKNVGLGLRLRDGQLNIDRLHLALPGGPLTARFVADTSTADVPVTLVLHAPAVPLALVARYADLPGQTSGGIKVDADLRGAGRSPHDLAASLDGSFSATMTHGSLSNAALIKLASASLTALGIVVPAQGETVIRCFGLVGSFKKGVGRFDTIAVNNTYLELTGTGQIDLGTETVALKLHPLTQLAGASVAVPVLVEGPFRDLQGRLDASGLDQLGLLIDAWFGGDAPKTCSDAGLVP
jgi:uncharacterized protein involved in outer membrane biogenesis